MMFASRTIRIWERLSLIFGVDEDSLNLNDSHITETFDLDCHHRIDTMGFFECMVFPALLVMVVLGFTRYRLRLWPKLLGGRPAIAIPMNTLDGRSSRLSYAAAFGLMASFCIDMIFADLLFEKFFHPYFTILSYFCTAMLYSTVLYPIFACLTSRTVLGYLVGSLYVWVLMAISLVAVFDCDFGVLVRLFEISTRLPYLVCTAYLSCSLPYKCYQAIMYHITKQCDHRTADYMALHVQQLLQPQHSNNNSNSSNSGGESDSSIKSCSLREKFSRYMRQWFKSHVYEYVPGYRYSSWRLSVMVVSVICVYTLYNECLMVLVPTLAIMEEAYRKQGGITAEEDIMDAWYSYSNGTLQGREVYVVVATYCKHLIVTVTLTLTVVLVLSLGSLAKGFSTYKMDILAMYRGEKSLLSNREHVDKAVILANYTRYSSYVIAYAVFGFLLHTVIAVLLAAVFTAGLITPISKLKIVPAVLQLFLDMLPSLVVIFIIWILQRYICKFVFLRKDKQISLNNRRLFFMYTYYVVSTNVLYGIGSFALRMLRGCVYGLVYLTRLDRNILPVCSARNKDPGHNVYLDSLRVEYTLSHPVMIMFVRLLSQVYYHKRLYHHHHDSKRKNGGAAQMQKTRRRKVARNRWYLALTLHHNPQLVAVRHHSGAVESGRCENASTDGKMSDRQHCNTGARDGNVATLDISNLASDVNGFVRERSKLAEATACDERGVN